jgi:preprotein translocase subunit YajC
MLFFFQIIKKERKKEKKEIMENQNDVRRGTM